MGMIFITHDLGVIAEIADEVAVMYRGKLVEYGDVRSIFAHGKHPYTKGLLACRPKLDSPLKRLPTVPDYMDTIYHDDGSYSVEEKVLEDGWMDKMRTDGRERHLYPPSRLETLGFDGVTSNYREGTTFAGEDEAPLLQVKDLKGTSPSERALQHRRRPRPRGRWCELRRLPRADARLCRRVWLRQDHHRSGHHAAH